ncbi:hypothetical protein PINS_up002596 [Pythium insidiosum]|nr:hypothetical protein PINS_up002596 [Pythium insidiosum]
MRPVPLAHVLPRDPSEAYHLVDDLTKLVHLHEPAILQVLRKRFFHGRIYTSTGSILVAVNPFRRLDMYADSVKARYNNDGGDVDAGEAPSAASLFGRRTRRSAGSAGPTNAGRPPPRQTRPDHSRERRKRSRQRPRRPKLIMNYLAFVSMTRKTRAANPRIPKRWRAVDS